MPDPDPAPAPALARRRVHLVPDTADMARPNACAALRLLDPYAAPAVASVAEVTAGPTIPDGIDTIVLQRLACPLGYPADLEDLARAVTGRGIRLIYDLDDNLLDPHPDPGTEWGLSIHRGAVRALLRAADLVTVSTEPLAERVRHLVRRVLVLPNALAPARIPPVRAPRGPGAPLHIGYFGTFTHLKDLMQVAAPTRAALARLPSRPRLTLCGISTDARLPLLFGDVADVDILPATGDYDGFWAMMRGQHWDIGLAPLAPGAFERTKSDIKFLEYAALGTAGLYAEHPAYGSIRNGTTGLVAAPDAWADALHRLATDAALRARITAEARAELLARRTWNTEGGPWAALLQTT